MLSAIMTEAVELDIIPANPCTRMRGLPTVRSEEPQPLSAEQVRALAEAMPTPSARLLTYMAAYTGLRAGELAGLRRKDVDLLRGVVQVRQALKQLDPTVFGGPKTGKPRTVTLPRFLRAMLTEHLSISQAQGGPEGQSADSLVFTSPQGGVLRQREFVRTVFKPAVKKALPAPLRGFRFHDLRHTTASLLIAQGAHPKVIQMRLGHASITTTMDRYGHLFPDHDTSLIEGLDAAHDEAAAPSDNVREIR